MTTIIYVLVCVVLIAGVMSLLPDEEGNTEIGFWGALFLWIMGMGLIEKFEEFFSRITNYNEFVNHFSTFLKIVLPIVIIISASDFAFGIGLLILNFFLEIPVIYYFLSAIIVLLVMIFIRLNANKNR